MVRLTHPGCDSRARGLPPPGQPPELARYSTAVAVVVLTLAATAAGGPLGTPTGSAPFHGVTWFGTHRSSQNGPQACEGAAVSTVPTFNGTTGQASTALSSFATINATCPVPVKIAYYSPQSWARAALYVSLPLGSIGNSGVHTVVAAWNLTGYLNWSISHGLCPQPAPVHSYPYTSTNRCGASVFLGIGLFYASIYDETTRSVPQGGSALAVYSPGPLGSLYEYSTDVNNVSCYYANPNTTCSYSNWTTGVQSAQLFGTSTATFTWSAAHLSANDTYQIRFNPHLELRTGAACGASSHAAVNVTASMDFAGPGTEMVLTSIVVT